MAEKKEQEGQFPQNTSKGQSTHSTTGDGHPPRPGEPGYEEGGQGTAGGGSAKE